MAVVVVVELVALMVVDTNLSRVSKYRALNGMSKDA